MGGVYTFGSLRANRILAVRIFAAS
jgi:hypothetical protein